MFSGIIEGVGTIRTTAPVGDGRRLVIEVPESFRALAPGSSVAVNGACLTVVAHETGALVFDDTAQSASATSERPSSKSRLPRRDWQ